MFAKEDELIGIILPDQNQRLLLEKRFQINSPNEYLTFAEWCNNSSMSPRLVANLIQLYLDRNNSNVLKFDKISIQEIIEYVKLSHQFYNNHYLFRFEQLMVTSNNWICSSTVFSKLYDNINEFIQLFRAHINWEEKHPIPYIEFLDIQLNKANFSLEECYALIAKNNLNQAEEHDDLQHKMLQNILKQIQNFCLKNRFDLQWNYYYNLFKQFQQDLEIHEFIEDSVLFKKAKLIENKLNKRIEQRAILN